ncbi:hypothetical protein EYF80_017929 [Liparis tanakae]|uniref:Uncharacterized protein n=1 Tax=Liparis tanakae TaxID=230148 RepID=A0A4Z2I3S7_9TELE|nr:hypothetical protein EYF80_017929 [Liparis tanakae]
MQPCLRSSVLQCLQGVHALYHLIHTRRYSSGRGHTCVRRNPILIKHNGVMGWRPLQQPNTGPLEQSAGPKLFSQAPQTCHD